MVADNINHNGACLQMNTGEQAFSRPSLGSWLLYGLGSENQNLPGFVVISPAQPAQGAPLWSVELPAGGLPGHAGLRPEEPDRQPHERRDLTADASASSSTRSSELNELHRRGREDDSRLDARIAVVRAGLPHADAKRPRRSTSTARSQATQTLYGLDEPATDIFGTQCLMARRLVERGVRFVQVYHTQTVEAVELPALGPARRPQDGTAEQLRRDRQADRRPAERPQGARAARRHAGHLGRRVRPHARPPRAPTAASTTRSASRCGWPAAASRAAWPTARPTSSAGTPSQDKVHVHDLHATILHLMGIDHEKLTYRHAGRDYRLTDVSGEVVQKILA